MYSSCNYLPVTTNLTKYECKVCGISDINFHKKSSTVTQDTGKNILQLSTATWDTGKNVLQLSSRIDIIVGLWQQIVQHKYIRREGYKMFSWKALHHYPRYKEKSVFILVPLLIVILQLNLYVKEVGADSQTWIFSKIPLLGVQR
jgi:hypothetical protein